MSSAPTAPPAASVRVPAGTTAGAAVREAGSAELRPAGGRRGPGRRRPAARPGLGPRGRRRGRAGRRGHRRRPLGHPALDRARARPGGAGQVSGRQAGHRPADQGRLLLRLRRRPAVHPGGSGRPREADAQDHQVRPAVRPAGGRFARSRAGRVGFRALQARADRPEIRCAPESAKESRRGRRRRADHLRQPARAHRRTGVGRPVPRPARADHPLHPGVPAHPQRRRLLAGQREEPAAATDLRHRLGIGGGHAGVPGMARRGRATGPPQARRRTRPLLLPGRDRLRPGGFPSQGRHHPQRDGELLTGQARRRRVLVRQHPAHHQVQAVRDLRAPGLVRGRDVPGRCTWTPNSARTARCASPGRTTTSSR